MSFIIAASVLSVAAWVYLLAGHGGFWRTDQRLPPAAGSGADGARIEARQPGVPGDQARSPYWPSVVAVIPARDEADVLPQTLPTLLAQDYPGDLTVALVDDQSSDGTAQVAGQLGHDARRPARGAGARLRIVAGEPLPPGWAGKVWAMQQGLAAAGDADYVLFTDADIAFAPGTLTALVRAAQASGRVLVSQMALLRSDTFWEKLLIPAFVYFFAQLYPFRRVNAAGNRTAAAAGGCMLVRRSALVAAGGLEPIRAARIDDVALGRLLKQAGGECWLGFTTEVTSHREYATLAPVWDMVARSAYTQLRYSPAALAGTVVGMIWLYLLPAAATAAGIALLADPAGRGHSTAGQAAWLAVAGLTGWTIMSVSYLPMLRLTGLSLLRAPFLPLIAALYTAMTASSAWRHRRGRGGEWKGRTIEPGQLPR